MEEPLGYKYKNITQFPQEGSTDTEKKPNSSSHKVVYATKKYKKQSILSTTQKEYYLKPYTTKEMDEKIHQIEAISAEFYRFLLGHDRAPKVHLLLDEHNNFFGTVSQKFDKFESFYDVLSKEKKQIPNKKLINAGLGSIMAASFIMEENDLHGNNYGFNEHGKLCRIDFDQNLLAVGQGSDEEARPIVPGRPVVPDVLPQAKYKAHETVDKSFVEVKL